ncbi:Endonuclease/exonuclease/phosphatase, partial [Mycena galericulata]
MSNRSQPSNPTASSLPFRTLHQNCRRSKTVMNALLNSLDPADYDIICITEPYIYPKQRITTASPKWVVFYPEGTDRPRSLILVNKNIKSDIYQQVKVDSRNVTSLLFTFSTSSSLQIYSIYNPPDSNLTYDELALHLFLNPPAHPMLWHGDFNKHDSLWAGTN